MSWPDLSPPFASSQAGPIGIMSSKIRVLTIGHSYTIALNRAVARAVAQDPDFDVTVAAPNFFHGDLRDLKLDPEPERSPLRLVGLDARWTKRIHVFHYEPRSLRKLVDAGGFDLVHSWAEPYIYSGYQVARSLARTRIPLCFYTCQNLLKYLPPPFAYFERKTLARTQGWIGSGELVRQAMLARGYPERSGRVLPLAVDTANFRPPSDAAKTLAQAKLGLQRPVIGFVGRLTAEKGVGMVLRTMNELGGVRPWNLLFLGSGPLEKEIRDWAAVRGWTDRVKIVLARHDEVPGYLQAMDLLVAPSQTTPKWKEQFGRMLIEAFACGVPVVASDSGEIPYVVGDAGRIVPENDVAAWVEAVTEILDRPDLRAELAGKGLNRCENYNLPTVTGQYRDYYRWLVDQPVVTP